MPVNTSISKLWGNKRNAYVSEILFPPLPISDDLKNIIDSARIWWDLHAHCYLKFHKCKHFGKELGSKCIETFMNGHSSFISHPKEKHEIHSTIMNKKSHHFFLTVKNWEWLNLCYIHVLDYHAGITNHVFGKQSLKKVQNNILSMVPILYKLNHKHRKKLEKIHQFKKWVVSGTDSFP